MVTRGLAPAAIVIFAVFAVATHLVLLWITPSWETDRQVAAGLRRAGGLNILIHAPRARAGATSVPLANPDTLSSRAYLDLSKGPLVLTGVRPDSCSYWSASVFAHNTDAVLVRSDRDSPDRIIALGLRTAAQRFTEPVRDQAVLPSPKGVLLIRCFMRDRMDKAYLAKLDAERRQLTLRPAAGGVTG
jgi:uncharacterized membrane protein